MQDCDEQGLCGIPHDCKGYPEHVTRSMMTASKPRSHTAAAVSSDPAQPVQLAPLGVDMQGSLIVGHGSAEIESRAAPINEAGRADMREASPGLVWWRQQKTHLLAHARDGVVSMQRCDSMP